MSSMKVRQAAIKALEDRAGRVTAEDLVAAARDRKHPLHGDFEWDDHKAAHQYRLNQARQLISSVRVVMTVETKQMAIVGYVRDPEAAPLQGYRAVAKIRSERDVAVEALLVEIERVQSILERAQGVAIGLGLEDEFHASLDATLHLRGKLRIWAEKEVGPALHA